MPTLNSFSI